MSEELDNQVELEVEDDNIPTVSEVKILKEQADIMGIQYPKNATAAKMKELIEAHNKKLEEDEAKKEDSSPVKKVAHYDKSKIGKVRAEAEKLIRVKIINQDPSKQSWTGITITAGNDVIGHIQRVVPLNADEWHVEAIILEHMRNMKYQHFPQKKGRNDSMYADPESASLLPVFQIIELPPLTEKQLADLAKQQAQQGTGQSKDK